MPDDSDSLPEGWQEQSFLDFLQEYPTQAAVAEVVAALCSAEGADSFVLVLTEDGELQQFMEGTRDGTDKEVNVRLRMAIAEALGIPVEDLI